MPFTDHDDVVQTFPANRANHPLGIRVLPWRARRNDGLPDIQRLGLMRKSFSVDVVAVTDEVPGRFQAARLEQLPRCPFCRWMLGDVEMHQPAPAVTQHHEHKQHPEKKSNAIKSFA